MLCAPRARGKYLAESPSRSERKYFDKGWISDIEGHSFPTSANISPSTRAQSLAPVEAAADIEREAATGASDAVGEAVSWWESILCCGALGYTCGKGLMDSARHVISCHLTQEMRVQNA